MHKLQVTSVFSISVVLFRDSTDLLSRVYGTGGYRQPGTQGVYCGHVCL